MGWDAASSANIDWENDKLEDENLDHLFKLAAKYVKEKTGTVDGYLELGGLDVSNCAYMLEKATGKNCWNEKGWSVEEVKQLQESANWNFEYDEEEAWSYWSAKKFLEVCAEASLSISFSY